LTLIELMIALAVLGILASLAWPLYTEQVRQSQRKTAAQTLLQAQLFVEAYRAQNHRWPADSQTDPTSLPAELRQSPPQGRAAYHLELQRQSDGLGYVLLALPVGAQSSDPCGPLLLNSQGQRWASGSARGSDDSACWP
jgi:type IV pilus assembly protein PilE